MDALRKHICAMIIAVPGCLAAGQLTMSVQNSLQQTDLAVSNRTPINVRINLHPPAAPGLLEKAMINPADPNTPIALYLRGYDGAGEAVSLLVRTSGFSFGEGVQGRALTVQITPPEEELRAQAQAYFDQLRNSVAASGGDHAELLQEANDNETGIVDAYVKAYRGNMLGRYRITATLKIRENDDTVSHEAALSIEVKDMGNPFSLSN